VAAPGPVVRLSIAVALFVALAGAPSRAAADAVPPLYDLAADLATRAAALRVELGPRTTTRIASDVFLLVSPSAPLGESARVAEQAIAAYFHDRFARRPGRAVAVILFEHAAPYEAWCRAHEGAACISPYGFYEAETRTVVMNAGPGLGTLTHELVHPIVEADFPQAPDWINEGIASLYEAFSLPSAGEIRGHKNWRWPRLARALASSSERSHASLSALFAMSDREFRGAREDLNYATARYFCQWMDAQGKLWPFYRAWRDGFARDPTGRAAFVATMGATPEAMDAAWAAWARAL
jgi:hypothetical protein